jgi:hypothetical protein
VPLDSIVSLTVAIAEAPGSYAFFLGSGVSQDAGVPTGAEVFWLGVAELYRLENESRETPDQEGLRTWLEETGREDLDYSGLLELIAPDAPTRREYLAKHFEGRDPGSAHERLAALAEAGYIRVFITTNFDRVLERALQARGIEPVVITSAAELAAAPRREHTSCYVVKPHGDYLQETIRNTRGELADLGPEMTTELREIFDRYGVVVLGYSGTDEAIAGVIRERGLRYGLYWVARSDPGAPARTLIEASGGRLIERDTASGFLGDLDRRLQVYREHPSGNTPVEVHDEVRSLVQAGDRIGLSETMRRERREFATSLSETIEHYRQGQPTADLMVEAHDLLLPALERRLSGLLPLIAYDVESFGVEVRSITELMEPQPVVGGFTFWPELADWSTWWLAYASGAFAMRLDRVEALDPLLSATFTTGNDYTQRLAEPVRESAGHSMAEVVMARAENQSWAIPRYSHLIWSLKQLDVLKERWPEMLEPDEEQPSECVDDFDFLVTLRCGLESGRPPLAQWSMRHAGAVKLARRLRRDGAYRAQVAAALGFEPGEFFDRAAESLANYQRPTNTFADSTADQILLEDQTGD